MSACATKALTILLRKAEGGWARESERQPTLAFTAAGFPDYFSLPTREARTQVHAVLRNAEKAGAIEVTWDRHAGEDGQVTRLRLVDRDRLAQLLAATPLWRVCAEAETALRLGPVSRPSVRAIHEAWSAGRSPRKLGPDRVADFVDALRVLEACQTPTSGEIALRRLSAQLFHDSKRIEAITPALDLLLAQTLSAPPRPPEEVWTGLGLVKHPQAFLCGGTATLQLAGGTTLALPAPYLGIAPRTLAGITYGPGCRYVLSVENLTTFNELAEGSAGPIAGLLLYTAGMPSPSFAHAYRLAVAALPPDAAVLHWGDIDRGGFRIAAALCSIARTADRVLRLFNMNPALITGMVEHRPLPTDEVREIVRLAELCGWEDEARGVEAQRLAYEQEALFPQLPA